MNIDFVTKEDLQELRISLLNDIRKLLTPAASINNEWLKGREVRVLLKISPGTLQNLRISGKLHPSKIGGIYYYRSTEIDQLLLETKLS